MWGRCSASRRKSERLRPSGGFSRNPPPSTPPVHCASLPMEPGLRHHSPLAGGLEMVVVISNWRAFALGVSSVAVLALTVGFAGCTVIQPPPDFTNPPSAADVTFDEIANRYLEQTLPLTP